jgi:hypothetical protein
LHQRSAQHKNDPDANRSFDENELVLVQDFTILMLSVSPKIDDRDEKRVPRANNTIHMQQSGLSWILANSVNCDAPFFRDGEIVLDVQIGCQNLQKHENGNGK